MMSRVGVLWDADDRSAAIGFKEYEAAAQAMKIGFQSLEIWGPNPDWEGTFQAAAKGHVNALITIRDPLLSRYGKQIAEFAIKNRLPSMHERNDFVEAGGLMSYLANDAEIYRRAIWCSSLIQLVGLEEFPQILRFVLAQRRRAELIRFLSFLLPVAEFLPELLPVVQYLRYLLLILR